jgi:hypothetical protein
MPAAPLDPQAATERFLTGFRCGEANLPHPSPVGLPADPRQDGTVLVEALYAPGEHINFVSEFARHTEKSGEVKARPMGKGVTLERDALAARFAKQGADSSEAGGWPRMNPLDGKGIADVNDTSLRFALLESDALAPELQLALFARLPLPLCRPPGLCRMDSDFFGKVGRSGVNGRHNLCEIPTGHLTANQPQPQVDHSRPRLCRESQRCPFTS